MARRISIPGIFIPVIMNLPGNISPMLCVRLMWVRPVTMWTRHQQESQPLINSEYGGFGALDGDVDVSWIP